MYRLDGSQYMCKGPYLICDGGYHKWRCLQCPMKNPDGINVLRFCKMVESMRKDSECTFGILKGRFRILKYGFRYHDSNKIDNVVFSCAILHNMLLRWDGLDEWERGVDYERQDGLHEVDDLLRIIEEDPGNANLQGDYSMTNKQYRSRRNPHSILATHTQSDNVDLFRKLVINFITKRRLGKVQWPERRQ